MPDRLTRAELAEVSEGKTRRLHGSFFSLAATPLAEGANSKFTCAVSVKVARKAVERNRIKRLCREAARSAIKKDGHHAYVFYAKREARIASLAHITRDITFLLEKACRA